MLTLGAVRIIIAERRFTDLIDHSESDVLEAKGQLYQLDDDNGKIELAKDVSALANNADGGYLLIGLRTVTDPNSRYDRIAEIRPFKQLLLDVNQYRNILASWVYPSVEDLEIEWVSADSAHSEGNLRRP